MAEEFVTPEFIDNSDPDTIQSRMMNNLPVDISDMPADFPYDFTMPTAIEISRLIQYNLTRTLMLMFPMWAWGEWLDLHGVSAKVTRKQASRASRKGRYFVPKVQQIRHLLNLRRLRR